MKKVFFIVFNVFLLAGLTQAQTIKTGVLVIGNGNQAIGASVQSANLGVKTVLMMSGENFDASFLSIKNGAVTGSKLIENGWRMSPGDEALKEVLKDKKKVNSAIEKQTDTIKNLTVIKNISWKTLKRSGSGWIVQLTDGRKIKAMVLVSADLEGKVNAALQVKSAGQYGHPLTYNDHLYRTSIAALRPEGKGIAELLFLSDLLIPGQENLVQLDAANPQIVIGQAAGTVASYASFYKTKTSLVPFKQVQSKLIERGLSVFPFASIENADSNWKAIQFIGLSGFLKADVVHEAAYFRPEQTVTVAEIKEPIKSFYYKAQIWFDDYKAEEMTIGATIDLVCKVGNKALDNTTAEIKKKWKSTYGFKMEFDAARKVNRREFAVLVNEYLRPFDVNIDQTGRVLR